MAFTRIASGRQGRRFGPLILLGALALVLMLWLPTRIVDWLWMGELGYRQVFWRILEIRGALFVAAFLLSAVYLRLNLRAALQLMAAWRAATGEEIEGPLAEVARSGLLRRGLVAIVALVPAFSIAALWDDAIRFYFGGDFGRPDPLLGLDVGFYVFRLPLIEALTRWVLVFTVLVLLAQAGLCLALGVFGRWRALDLAIRRRVAVVLGWNLALAALASAASYVLSRFSLLHASGGTVRGPGFVDVHVVMPALLVMAVLALSVALLAAVAIRRADVRTLVAAAAGVVVAHVVVLGVVPTAVQAVFVKPSEFRRERPYLEYNIGFTRLAFGIDAIEERSYPAEGNLGMAAIERNRDTVRNIRLWDYQPLLLTFGQIQQIRLYYQFYDVDVDRYPLTDGYRQTMVAARELTRDLPQRAETWVNRHLQYTHGYGLAMSLAAQEREEEGTPNLVIKDLPPVASRGAPIGNPAIYYGEHMPGYAIVPSGIPELDYPEGDSNAYASYRGTGGVPLASFWSRLLFAFYLDDVNILLTGYTTDASRIQIRRSLMDRVHRIAPFLRLDRDPYLVTTPNGLYWIEDGYTTSDRFPYSEAYEPTDANQAGGPFNYIRNSVKIVMDAYNGGVGFYVMDPDEPVLAAYRRAFPGLFRPLAELPSGLREHLRYPQDLFEAQTARYAAYHMRDPQVFYNTEDLWTVPREKYGGTVATMEPYYMLMRLPGEDRLEFMLMLPMTPQGRDNLIAWIAARSDYPDYGRLVAFKLPKDRLIYGPMQVEALIDQNTEVSRQLSLWDQRGSRVIRGSLLVIPIDHSLLYVEPVYLVADQNGLPQLKRVIVAQGDRVAMQPTLELAIRDLFGESVPGVPSGVEATPPAVLSEVQGHLAEAEAALARGDWQAFGAAMVRLKQTVNAPDGAGEGAAGAAPPAEPLVPPPAMR